MRVALLFDFFGPYHLARSAAAAERCTLIPIQLGGSSNTYQWEVEGHESVTPFTLNPGATWQSLSLREMRQHIDLALSRANPDVVFVPGWGTKAAILSLDWAVENRVPASVMSESTSWDAPRRWLLERVKALAIRSFRSALVGGGAHQDYLEELGFSPDHIFAGYDVVDNEFFETGSNKWRAEISRPTGEEGGASPIEAPPVDSYFLASNRFIARKNLIGLIEAYAEYAKRDQRSPDEVGSDRSVRPWNLCLLGDGEQRSELIVRGRDLGLRIVHSAPWEDLGSESADTEFSPATPTLFFPGFRQINELPRFYASAGCFVHPALIEPWGLVVNEAMACGLPIIVSDRCGCASDLVEEGENGFLFDPRDKKVLADLLSKVADPVFPAAEFGNRSRLRIAGYGPESFADGLEAAARAALQQGPARPSSSGRMLLKILGSAL